MKRKILCIDLKSFYASCECLLLNKDPFTTSLVVASKTQGPGSITLAITPYLKNKGIKSRTRLYEIPKNIDYIHIHPKMEYYLKKSKEVISVYLDFVSIEDLHVYSIDEAFLDITNYLNYYNMTDYQLAKTILYNIFNKTGLHATCGIGENMFIAKTAMDIEAKYNKSNIAKWNYNEAKKNIKNLPNLTDMWGIGINMEKKLNDLNIFSILDLSSYNKNKLINKLGIIGEELWNHSNAIDEAIISEKNYKFKKQTFSNSQILFKDYDKDNIKLIIKETIETLTKKLRQYDKVCMKLHLNIDYSYNIEKNFNHSITFDNYTRDIDEIYNYCLILLNKYIKNFPIRKLSITLSNIIKSNQFQTSLFHNYKKIKKTDNLNKTIDIIHNKFGKNSITKASALLDYSTLIDRNNKLGGHSK